jgi:4-diphosphocytidyl-2-C-methyl-D-erythritol kinase
MIVFSEGYGRNDLQPVAAARFAVIAAALECLSRFQSEARMTGSGACVFASFLSRAAAQSALSSTLQALPEARGMVTRALEQHPLARFA